MFDTEELRELCGKAAGADVALATTDDLMEAALLLEQARSLVEVASAHVLARLDAEGATDRQIGMRTASWLGHESKGPRSRCRNRVRTARRLLTWFGTIDDAVSDGHVGWAHAELLCSVANGRNAAGLGEAQEHLVVLAGQFTYEQWAALVRHLAAELDQDGGYDPNEDVHANRLRLSTQGDRTVELAGRLVGGAGVTVGQTLDALADEIFHRFKRDQEADPALDMPTRSTLMALALEEACRRALAVDTGSSAQPGVEAVVVIENGPDGAELRSPDGTRLPDSATCLVSDPAVRALLIGGDGVPLELGRSRRLATPDQHLALAVRDGGCIFPGCDRPPGWCDAHHQPPWLDGGRTDIDGMALLCRHHHVVTHRPEWRIEPDPDRAQRWIWSTPSGRRLHSQRRRDSRATPSRAPSARPGAQRGGN